MKSVYKVALHTPRMSLVQRSKSHINDWSTDRQHNIRIGTYWENTHYKIIHRFAKGKKWDTLWEFEAFSEDQVWPMGFDEDPNFLYVRALHEGRDAIFRVDLRDETLKKELIYSLNGYDVDGHLIYSSLSKKVIGISSSTEGGYIFFDEKYQALQEGINQVRPDTDNYFYSMSKDERKYILLSTSDKDPGIYSFGDRDNKSLTIVTPRYTGLDSSTLVKKTYVSYKARDGLKISGYLSLPKDAEKGEKLPTIIFPHRGPISYNGKGFDYWTQFFANRGYAVLQMNFRGSSGYGYDFMQAGLQNWGLAMQDDIEDGARWLIKEGYSNPDRLCIVGANYGGYAALMGSVKTPDLYKCAISFAGVSDLPYLVKSSRNYRSAKIVQAKVGSDMKSLRERSPTNYAEKISIPVLLIHGTKDRSVSVEQSRKMHKKLKKAGKDVDYIELEDGNHFLDNNEHRIETFRAMEKFLNKHLGS